MNVSVRWLHTSNCTAVANGLMRHRPSHDPVSAPRAHSAVDHQTRELSLHSEYHTLHKGGCVISKGDRYWRHLNSRCSLSGSIICCRKRQQVMCDTIAARSSTTPLHVLCIHTSHLQRPQAVAVIGPRDSLLPKSTIDRVRKKKLNAEHTHSEIVGLFGHLRLL